MSLIIIAPNRNLDEWRTGIQAIDSSISIQVWPEVSDPDIVLGAIVWNHPEGSLRGFPNLKFISSMGAGVDHILKDPELPEDVPIVRIVDDALTKSMSSYLIMATLYYQRNLQKYISDKNNRVWDQAAPPEKDISVGIMGMGVLGSDVARKLSSLEFKVYGYSNTKKDVEGVSSFAGENELKPFLEKINVLICLLPLTKNTKDILNLEFFKKLNRGTYLINAARGHHMVEQDLIEAIELGYISGAFLDVYRKEPLPKDHRFWNHPQIMQTPHIASITNPHAAIPQILKNLKAVTRGESLENKIDRAKEY